MVRMRLLMRQSVDEILDKLQNSFVQNQIHKIIVEELVDDEFGYDIWITSFTCSEMKLPLFK